MVVTFGYYLEVDDAACEMLRSLPYCTDSIYSITKEGEWYYDFMNACLMHGFTAMLPRYINPGFERELGMWSVIFYASFTP